MEKYEIKNKTDIKMHNVLYAITSNQDYSMDRIILLEGLPDLKYNEFVLVEGGHCSCYDFDQTTWDATKLTKEELLKFVEKDNLYTYEDLRKKLHSFLKDYFNMEGGE